MKPFQNKYVKLYNADCLEVLKEFEEESIDLICTDPPYGLNFMGKDWDKALPDKKIWKECLRVLKPGAFALILCTPRQDCLSRMIVTLEDVGFWVNFTSIYWVYAEGFPKAQNLSRAANKRAGVKGEIVGQTSVCGSFYRNASDEPFKGEREGALIRKPTTEEAKQLEGAYGGFQPKPAIEPVIVVMKPCDKKTWVDQALKNGKGCTWLDDGRIPTKEKMNYSSSQTREVFNKFNIGKSEQHSQGRFPANLIIEDNAIDDGIERRSSNLTGQLSMKNSMFKFEQIPQFYQGDSGNFSRYFDLDAWFTKRCPDIKKTFPFLLCSKPRTNEKASGLDSRNIHPTVKPLKLMSWLIELGSRKNDIVLDPFLGSGTTALAAKMLDRFCIGIELDEEYFKIAKNHITKTEVQRKLF